MHAYLHWCVLLHARAHGGSLSRARPHFNDYNSKKLIQTIGPRGDPLKIGWYRVFAAIANENAMAGLCTYSRAFRGYTMQKSEKRCFRYGDPPSPGQVTHASVQARRYRFVCTDSCAQDRKYRFGCTHSCVQVCRYRSECTDSCVQVRTYRFVCTGSCVQIRPYRLVGTGSCVCKVNVCTCSYIHLCMGANRASQKLLVECWLAVVA